MTEDGTAPFVAAWTRTDQPDALRMWCHHCRRWHHHGQGEGHRIAHCHDEASPYSETGYVLVLAAGKAPKLRDSKPGRHNPF